MTMPNGLRPNAFLPNYVVKDLDVTLPVKAGSPKSAVKGVQERLSLCGFPVVVDGAFGPATAVQLVTLQKKFGLAQTGIYDAAAHDILCKPFVAALNPVPTQGLTLGGAIVALARQHIAQRPLEVGGPNSGPWVRMYMAGNDGAPWLWCAGFCFFIIDQACDLLGQPVPMKTTFGVDTIVDRAKTTNLFLSEQSAKASTGKARIVPGSLFTVRQTSISWSHVGIVSQADKDTFGTCEGNTNDDGSSNGYEALERVRGYKSKDFVVW